MSGTIALIHGAGSGPWIFDGWQSAFADFDVIVPDLQGQLEVGRATMDDYAARVKDALEGTMGPVGLCGWSMGGLIAAMVAGRSRVDALVLVEPSPPAETQGRNPNVTIEEGTFDSEAVYGTFPEGVRSRPESSPARAERKRGISIPSLPEQTLVVYGDEFVDDRGHAIATHYGCEEIHFPGVDHWGLILDERVPRAVAKFFLQALD